MQFGGIHISRIDGWRVKDSIRAVILLDQVFTFADIQKIIIEKFLSGDSQSPLEAKGRLLGLDSLILGRSHYLLWKAAFPVFMENCPSVS